MGTSGNPLLIIIVEAAKMILDLIFSWRRERDQKSAKLEAARSETENQRVSVETRAEHAKALRDQSAAADRWQAELARSQVEKNEAETSLIYAQAEMTQAEAEKLRASIR